VGQLNAMDSCARKFLAKGRSGEVCFGKRESLAATRPMPTARACKLCPKLIVLPGDYERYEQFSNWMFGYAYDFTPSVELNFH
jgi:hypothetical protein